MCWFSISGGTGCEAGKLGVAGAAAEPMDGGCANLNTSQTSKGVRFACQ
jgi:Na+-transporting NADH:ubiquinone oxidoreductase subunit NqrF